MKIVLGLALLQAVTAANVAPLTCFIVQKQQCEVSQPCVELDADKIFVKIDLQGRRYERCDRIGCDTYRPEISRSGIWTNVALPANGMLARLGERGVFVEVVTLGDVVLVSHGRCQ